MKLKLLYVDDEKTSLKYFASFFGKDYDIKVFGRPLAALGYLERHSASVDAVLADHRMPGMSGGEFLSQVAERWPGPARILTTAYANVECLCYLINQRSIDKVILKPWDVPKLKETIVEAVRSNEIAKQLDTSASASSQIHAIRSSLVRAELAAACGSQVPSQCKELNYLLREEISTARDHVEQVAHQLDSESRAGAFEVISMKDCLDEALGNKLIGAGATEFVGIDGRSDFLFLGAFSLMKNIIFELVINSATALAGHPKPLLKITVRSGEDFNSVIFEDNGNWHTAGLIKEIFEPFDKNRPNSGFGLALAEWFVQSMGGRLSFVPSEIGGLCATIRLPKLVN